jgi:hypothetical protein
MNKDFHITVLCYFTVRLRCLSAYEHKACYICSADSFEDTVALISGLFKLHYTHKSIEIIFHCLLLSTCILIWI